ncbi:TPA_asm: VRR-NUC domain-containing protein, partial [Listeria monocytogenes]|nr:VRR-NUC domain-containing protein [Listeria monocytogenes]HAA2949609.1 VRR-NUC domain-containing protein [Listeria monocytogenes]HAC4193776.1 VRR-NUC domain-containing protein [Listeria monocytogenes]
TPAICGVARSAAEAVRIVEEG